MSTEPHDETKETRHSALAEFQRDERRPAVMLLAILLIAAAFFALGIMVGRWTAADATREQGTGVQSHATPTPTN
jgi:ferric-dicitrate binding protein FerR (iron transport regulator)